MPETMKILRSSKNNITKNENGENRPHLEITEVVLVHCNFVNNDNQKIHEFCIHLFQIGRLVNHYISHLKKLYF